MHDPVERSRSVPAGPVPAWLVEHLIRVLSAGVSVVVPVWRSTRSHAGFVADQVRVRTRAYRDDEELIARARDVVDEHAASAVRELRPRSSLPPPLAHLEVLTGEALDAVVARVVALGRPDALASPAHGSWATRPREHEAYVDDRRMAAAMRVLDDERVELVRRS